MARPNVSRTKTADAELVPEPERKSRRLPPNRRKNIQVVLRLEELVEIVDALDHKRPLRHRLQARLLEAQERIDREMKRSA